MISTSSVNYNNAQRYQSYGHFFLQDIGTLNERCVTRLGKRLLQDSEGSVHLMEKTPAEVVGEKVLRPLLDKLSFLTAYVLSFTKYLPSLPSLPMAYAKEMRTTLDWPSREGLVSCLDQHPLTDRYLSEKGVTEAVAEYFADDVGGWSGDTDDVLEEVRKGVGYALDDDNLKERLNLPSFAWQTIKKNLVIAVQDCAEKDVPWDTSQPAPNKASSFKPECAPPAQLTSDQPQYATAEQDCRSLNTVFVNRLCTQVFVTPEACHEHGGIWNSSNGCQPGLAFQLRKLSCAMVGGFLIDNWHCNNTAHTFLHPDMEHWESVQSQFKRWCINHGGMSRTGFECITPQQVGEENCRSSTPHLDDEPYCRQMFTTPEDCNIHGGVWHLEDGCHPRARFVHTQERCLESGGIPNGWTCELPKPARSETTMMDLADCAAVEPWPWLRQACQAPVRTWEQVFNTDEKGRARRVFKSMILALHADKNQQEGCVPYSQCVSAVYNEGFRDK